MEANLLIVAWLVGAGIGLWYSARGMREAWNDLLAVPPAEEAAKALAASAFKTQSVRAAIQIVWLAIGVVALLSIAGILIAWGLMITNYALAWLSRESYLTKRRTLDALIKRQQKEKK